ncbi:acyl carrier protein [Paenibacillus sp. strain BS8-2]
MTVEQIKAKLVEHIMDRFQIDSDDDEFHPDVHLFDYGYIDSFGATELIAYIETEFGIEVTKKDLMLHSLNTVNEIVSFIQMKIGDR